MNIESVFEKIKIRYFWMFFTERCNLSCKYCFYRYRDEKTTLSFQKIKELIDFLDPYLQTTEFVISGGEPLLEWETTKKIIKYIRKKFENYLLLQSNGILMRRSIVNFLRKYRVNVEVGFDGMLPSFKKRGVDENKYLKLLKNLELLKEAGVGLSSTLTVHPEESGKLFKNYFYSLRYIPIIEITPAAFENWEERSVKEFKKEYLKCVKYSVEKKINSSLSTVYDRPVKGMFMDIVPLADGNVMTNWALSGVPREKREKYAIFSISNGFEVYFKRILHFLKIYRKLFEQRVITYRDFSLVHVELIYRLSNLPGFKGYRELCNFLKNTNSIIRGKK